MISQSFLHKGEGVYKTFYQVIHILKKVTVQGEYVHLVPIVARCLLEQVELLVAEQTLFQMI